MFIFKNDRDDDEDSECFSNLSISNRSSQASNVGGRTGTNTGTSSSRIGTNSIDSKSCYMTSEYSGFIDLRGPYSPLEVNYYALTHSSSRKRVRMERDSINYVTLDDDPVNPTNRLLVATDVSLNEMGTTMILRKTTLMPKIAGLSTVCCLLFAPIIEIRRSEKGAFFTGALCGLGFDEDTNTSIYKDNDIECAFDVIIDHHDLAMVN